MNNFLHSITISFCPSLKISAGVKYKIIANKMERLQKDVNNDDVRAVVQHNLDHLMFDPLKIVHFLNGQIHFIHPGMETGGHTSRMGAHIREIRYSKKRLEMVQ